VLKLCLDHPGIRAPQFQGLYSGSRDLGIAMSYAGTAMKDIFSATDHEKFVFRLGYPCASPDTVARQQLVSILQALHRKGIHHHDVRAENIMVNHRGFVTLVDFDRAVIVDERCSYCPDLEMIAVLERSMGNSQGYDACYL
jgi:tRNA A-37 threonylcarbamoyl transferase component Bud32